MKTVTRLKLYSLHNVKMYFKIKTDKMLNDAQVLSCVLPK